MTIFDQSLDQLRSRTSMKWRAYADDVLPLWVAEMDCLPAPSVRRALIDAVETGDTGYPSGTPYEEAFARYAADVWGWRVADGSQIIVPDVMQGIIAVLGHLDGPGGAVVVTPPVYPQFYRYLEWADREVVEVPLTEEGRLDLDGLSRAFAGELGAKPSAFLLCNPHNPHGTVHSPEELAEVLELGNRHGVRVVSDEIHAPLVDATLARHTPILKVPGSEQAVVVTSASKSWNLAGLKAGLAIGGAGCAERLATMPPEITHSASHLGIVSHAAALDGARDWLTEAMTEITANKVLLGELLGDQLPGVRFTSRPGTYLAWLDCRELGLANPQQAFLAAGVALNDGASFGAGGAGHVRMNLATSPELITEAVRRMATAR